MCVCVCVCVYTRHIHGARCNDVHAPVCTNMYIQWLSMLRIDPRWWHHLKIPLVTWTVNDAKIQAHFRDVLQIPFMTDRVTVEGPK